MRTLILISSLIILTNISSAQTYVSGFISSNTTWDLAGSPYIVIGNTLLSYGYTLTIEPGVVIKFDTGKALQIDGELIAIGTPQNRITFTSYKLVPAAGDWAKLHFSDLCTDAIFDLSGQYISGSIMKYCDILYGGRLGFGSIHIISSAPYFSNCRISYSQANGIYSLGNTYTIDSSYISHCSDAGLFFDRYYDYSCSIKIANDTLANNSGGGIEFNSYYGWLNCDLKHVTEIKNNLFLSNSPFALYAPGCQWDSLIVTENTFENNYGNGSTFKFSSTTYTIECNRFINNQNGTGILRSEYGDTYNSQTSSYYVNHNIFQGNTVAAGNAVVYLYNVANDKDIYFTNNIIKNCSGGQIFKIEGTVTNIFQIHHNEITDNSGNSALYIASPGVGGTNYEYVNMRLNNLINPGCQYEFNNNIPYGGPNLEIDSNYWGSQSTQHLDSMIYDYFDYANLSVVFYLPLLPFPTEADTLCPAINVWINEFSNKITSAVYPNPFSEFTTIHFDKSLQSATFEVYNIFGQILRREILTSADEVHFNRSSLSEGIYFYRVKEKEGITYSGKLIIN